MYINFTSRYSVKLSKELAVLILAGITMVAVKSYVSQFLKMVVNLLLPNVLVHTEKNLWKIKRIANQIQAQNLLCKHVQTIGILLAIIRDAYLNRGFAMEMMTVWIIVMKNKTVQVSICYLLLTNFTEPIFYL